jgi:glycosyltransferase involved in cell wall biosynthesis
MKILHVIHWLAVLGGGPPAGLATLARAQAERGHKVQVLPCARGSGPTTLPNGQDGNLFVHEPPSLTTSGYMYYNRRVRAAAREIAKGQDIIHIHGTWRFHLLAAGWAACEYEIPDIIRPAGNLGTLLRRHRAFLKVPYFHVFEKLLFERAAAIHCTSRKEAEELKDWHVRSRCFIVPQPIRSDLVTYKAGPSIVASICPQLRESDRVILNIGRIWPKKQLELLLEAFIQLQPDFHDLHLVLAGPHLDKHIVQRIQARSQEAGVASRVSLPGMVLGEQKAALLARATLFALPSIEENFGISVAEAMLFGLPCVVSDGVALGDEIAKHNAGITTRSNVECFTAAMRELLSNKERLRICSEAARLVAQSFTPTAVCDQLDVEYERCLMQRQT